MISKAALADAIVTYLGTQNFADGVTIARKRIVSQAVDEIAGKHVSVIPFGRSLGVEAIGVPNKEIIIPIVVQAKLDGNTDGDLADACDTLVESVGDCLIGHTIGNAQCSGISEAPNPSPGSDGPGYDPQKMDSLDFFDATIRTTWQAVEDGD